jgi:hypothetical protein
LGDAIVSWCEASRWAGSAARHTRGDLKPPCLISCAGHSNGQGYCRSAWRIRARRKHDDRAGRDCTCMTTADGAGVGGRRARVERCQPRKGQCRRDFQLGAKQYESDEHACEQKKHCRTKLFHLNYPLAKILTGQCAELSGLSRQLRTLRVPRSQASA